MRMIIMIAALLIGLPSFAHAQAATSQDVDGNVQFMFNGVSSIKVAPVGAVANQPCPATSAGAIRYNQGTGAFEGCDNTNFWTPLSHQKGTWDGYCREGWGGVDQVGTAIAPAYYDPAPRVPCGDAAEQAYAASKGWTCRMGCQCPSGYTKVWIGTCDFGYCTSAATGGSLTAGVFMNACMKQ